MALPMDAASLPGLTLTLILTLTPAIPTLYTALCLELAKPVPAPGPLRLL